MPRRIIATLRRALELRWLLPLLMLAGLSWSFMKLTSEVLEGDSHAVDQWVLAHLRVAAHQPVGGPALAELARDLTALGSPAVLLLVSLAAFSGLWLVRQRELALVSLGAALGGVALNLVLKGVFTRSRPDALYHATVVSGYSFPSGHAMMSAVVYLTLAALLARLMPRGPARLWVMSLATVVTGIVGLTRVYLGVHWASDVVGGWTAGAAWALASWCVAERLDLGPGQRR